LPLHQILKTFIFCFIEDHTEEEQKEATLDIEKFLKIKEWFWEYDSKAQSISNPLERFMLLRTYYWEIITSKAHYDKDFEIYKNILDPRTFEIYNWTEDDN